MKKLFNGILLAAALLCIGTTGVFAAGQWQGRNFTDEDGDGVCDYAACTFVDADGDGVCDNAGMCAGRGANGMRTGRGANGYGANFIDEDGNGICDNFASRVRPQDGSGRQNGVGRRGNR